MKGETGSKTRKQVRARMRRVLKNVHAVGRQSPQQRPSARERAAAAKLAKLAREA